MELLAKSLNMQDCNTVLTPGVKLFSDEAVSTGDEMPDIVDEIPVNRKLIKEESSST